MNRDCQARIFTFLLTSARGCVDEPPLYGPLRLLEAYSLLLGMLKSDETDEFYYKLNEKIEALKDRCMEDEGEFIEGLDRVLEELTGHIIDEY
ncbi:MAG: DUF6092 family protein [Bacillota bacterium]|jgi:hypothetical protein|nr:DUF6092 family protein [Bacillota bacterium]MDD3298419.1 DUF6092 family protein [Bacillota bacterium]MDD3850603.1 DUF6092 family protein [Bacillota bacterium]MDD4707415.1 DUF6092 family protein [Bacillota bacterium]